MPAGNKEFVENEIIDVINLQCCLLFDVLTNVAQIQSLALTCEMVCGLRVALVFSLTVQFLSNERPQQPSDMWQI